LFGDLGSTLVQVSSLVCQQVALFGVVLLGLRQSILKGTNLLSPLLHSLQLAVQLPSGCSCCLCPHLSHIHGPLHIVLLSCACLLDSFVLS